MTRLNLSTSDAALVLIGTTLTIALLALMPATPLVTADSSGYVDFAPIRTAGYPLFLDLFGRFAIIAQIVIFAVCAVFLARQVASMTNGWMASGLLIALLINPEVAKFHYSILTESIFLSVDCLLLGCALRFIRGGSALWILGALCGIAFAIRPAAVALLVVPIMLGAAKKDHKGLALALLAFAALAGGERLYAYHVHGDKLSSLSGRHLFAKAALIDAPPADRRRYTPLEDRLADALERDYVPVRALLDRSHGPIHTALMSDYEVCIQWACQAPLGIEAIPRRIIDPALRKVAIDRIRKRPGGYLQLAWYEYVGLWSIGARTHPSIAPLYDRTIKALEPMPLRAQFQLTGALDPTSPRRAALIARPVLIAMGFAMALILLVSAWLWRRPLFLGAAMAALSLQASFAFVALTAVGYGRYTMAMWPNMVVALTLFAVGSFTMNRVVDETGA